MYYERFAEKQFLKYSRLFKAVLVVGARQVGKTTMLKHLAEPDRTYVSLDDPDIRNLAKTNPQQFFMRFKPPILIDEVQKAPELFDCIKLICDDSEERGLFWLTGSDQHSLLKNASESLAGRIGSITLHPLSYNEIHGVKFTAPLDFTLDNLVERHKQAGKYDLHDIFNYIWTGGLPEAQNISAEDHSAILENYKNYYLLRDAMNAANADEISFDRILRACAAMTGNLVNYTALANISGIKARKIEYWLQVLEGMHIIYLLQPYGNNLNERLVKTPKLYFWDTGLCAYLSKWLTVDTLMAGNAAGAFFENYVVNELIKDLDYSSVNYDLSFYRDSNIKEIDLFIGEGRQIHPIEVKLSATPDWKEVKKYSVIDKSSYERGRGGIVCASPNVLPINNMDSIIPANIL
ncbi:MAG: ATP-binding protein [Clostridia bacterium]|nr:ATP-binding protein [Clostridia bacterium]